MDKERPTGLQTDGQKWQFYTILRTQNPRSTTAMQEPKHFVFTQPLLCAFACVWVGVRFSLCVQSDLIPLFL